MSVLSFPRLYFQGYLSWDPDVTNNDPDLWDPVNVNVVLPQGVNLDTYQQYVINNAANPNIVVLENSRRLHEYFPTQEFERAAAAMGDLVYRSDGTIPGPDDGLIFEYSGSRDLARRLLTADAFGPGIRIYRIRR